MKIALGQLAATDDKERNLRVIAGLARKAAAQGAELVAFPEEAMYTPSSPEQWLGPIAEPLDGAFVEALRTLAGELGLTLIAGVYEEAPEDPDRAYNTVVAVQASGELGSYRKVHLFDALGFRESDRVLEGDGSRLTLDAGGIRLGILNCYDLRFPELARLLIDDGAELLVVCAAWAAGKLKEDQWVTLLRARAIENTCWVAGVGEATDGTIGRSMLVDPMGAIRASLGEEREALLVAEVDPARTAAVRDVLPSVRNRRFMVSA